MTTAQRRNLDELNRLIVRAINRDEGAVRHCISALDDPAQRRVVFHGVLVAAQESSKRLEALRKALETSIVPAMVRGSWRHNGAHYLDIEMAGQRLYCAVGAEEQEVAAKLGAGEEIAVARVEQGPPFLVRPLNRPFETTGRYGLVVDTKRLEDGGYELELESGNETFACLAAAEVAEVIAKGDVDALGGLPITAVHNRGLVWKLFQRKGKAEQRGDDLESVTLADYAGYSELRQQVCRLAAMHVLSLEPLLLADRAGLRRKFTNPTFRGIFSTGPPGTGKTFLMLALVGSLRAQIGVPKARAKRAALRLWAATHPAERAFEDAGRPGVEDNRRQFNDAVSEQYAGLREFGLPVPAPELTADDDLAAASAQLLEGYGIPTVAARRKLRELDQLVEAGKSDFMVLTMRSEDYIRSVVGEGLNALSAQLKRAQNHDDLAILCLPEAEVLLARRGHHSRFYTDELVNKLLEVLDGPVACRNLFVLADGNRADMIDTAFDHRRLKTLRFPGLGHDDRRPVIQAVLAGHGVEKKEVDALAEKLLDLIYAETPPLCELVMIDESTIPLLVDHVLTPALIRNVVRAAADEALAAGRTEFREDDLEGAWERELRGQAERFGEREIVSILGLDRQKAARVIEVRRREPNG